MEIFLWMIGTGMNFGNRWDLRSKLIKIGVFLKANTNPVFAFNKNAKGTMFKCYLHHLFRLKCQHRCDMDTDSKQTCTMKTVKFAYHCRKMTTTCGGYKLRCSIADRHITKTIHYKWYGCFVNHLVMAGVSHINLTSHYDEAIPWSYC